MDSVIPVENGAEAFLELLNANGVEYIFFNPGTDTYAIQEAVCKNKVLGKKTPEIITCLHESVAMAAAHGYFMVSGRPQVVFVHADLGLQQVGGAVHNAQRGRAGVVLCAGRVPSNIDKGRMNQVHWMQEQFDQAGTVRNYIKWEYKLQTNENIHHVVNRAFQMAASEPCGPVYLEMPQDLLAERQKGVTILPAEKHRSISMNGIDDALLNEISETLLKAESPLIITGYSGRSLKTPAALVDLAEVLGARVISVPSRMNYPSTHPLFCGFDPTAYIPKSDAILVIDLDIPYVPARVRPAAGARIIYLDMDPLKNNLPMWGFPADILVQANSERALPALSRVIRSKSTPEYVAKANSRLARIGHEHMKLESQWLGMAAAGAQQNPIAVDHLCMCLNEVLDENTVVLGEAVTNAAAVLRQIKRKQPGTYFQSGGSNLGWGLGAALGAKLAAPDKTVVTIEGDGSFIFGCPTAALWAACTFHAPFLTVILNNTQYTAPRLILKQAAGIASYSEKSGNWVGTEIKPSPDYSSIAGACGAWGETVFEPSAIKPAAQRALEQVKAGIPAVLDVRIDQRF